MRHTALPSPGTEEQLRNLAARIHSQQLDRAKPLWETWLVEGLEGDRFALISKTHHALVDGIAGVDLATVLFDPPDAAAARRRGRAVAPAAASRPRSTCRAGVRGLVRTPFELAGRAASRGAPPGGDARRPRARRSRASARSCGRRSTRRPRRRSTSRSARTGGSSSCASELDDFKLVKNAFGGTVNDVVLTVVGGRAATLAALARRAHRGARAARARAGLDPQRATSAASSATGSR